ncbi:hypothetical protein PIB30_112219, partial [Stylosanthes scabra]|nr:hypothetical protein [Stylosanthes scabra]
QTFTVVEVQDPGPSAGYLRWWFLAARRFLDPDDAFYPRPPDEIPPEAIQRVADTPVGGNQVDDVPDNRRPGRRRMVGTRTTDRDWQWLDEMLGDEAAAPRHVRRMPEDGGRMGGRGEDGGADGGEAWALHLSPMVVRAVLIRQGLVSRARYPLLLSTTLTAASPCSVHLQRIL